MARVMLYKSHLILLTRRESHTQRGYDVAHLYQDASSFSCLYFFSHFLAIFFLFHKRLLVDLYF